MDKRHLRAEKLFMRADDLIKDKKIDEAMDILYECIETYPDFGRAYNHLGWIYETKMSNYAKAEECYKLALENEPSYRAVYYNYAILLSTCKRYKELENLLQRAQNIAGIDMGTLYNEHAIMYEAQGYYDQAIEYYKKYIAELHNTTNINTALDSIDRCRRKQDILGRY